MVLHWTLLIWSLITTAAGVYSIYWHSKLDDELENGNPRNVRYEDYLTSGLLSSIGTIAGALSTIACIYLLICE